MRPYPCPYCEFPMRRANPQFFLVNSNNNLWFYYR